MSDREKIENKTIELKDHEVSRLASQIANDILNDPFMKNPQSIRIKILHSIRTWQGMSDR